jgi:hypothetical protein
MDCHSGTVMSCISVLMIVPAIVHAYGLLWVNTKGKINAHGFKCIAIKQMVSYKLPSYVGMFKI